MNFGTISSKGVSYLQPGILQLKLILLQSLLFARCYANDPSSFFVENDACATYDTCKVREFFRTCSCDDDCYKYKTCCFDAPSYPSMKDTKEEFQCHSDRISQPVFVKRSCSPDFDGDVRVKTLCEKAGSDISDLMQSIPVSSSKTMNSYWNWNCGICNGENQTDLSFWTVQASCPVSKQHKRFDIDLYRQNMVYSQDLGQWGVMDEGEFMNCPIDFFQPAFLMGSLKYCVPDVVSECPDYWRGDETRANCHSFYGERKKKGTSMYYKNVHCAICNGLTLNDLECLGRNYPPKRPSGNLLTMRIVFNLNTRVGEYVEGQLTCTNMKRYDPFLRKCRSVKCGLVNIKQDYDYCGQSVAGVLEPSIISIVILTIVCIMNTRRLL